MTTSPGKSMKVLDSPEIGFSPEIILSVGSFISEDESTMVLVLLRERNYASRKIQVGFKPTWSTLVYDAFL